MRYKKNILIVGGTGFVGYHLAKKSLKKDWQVTSISSRSPRKIRRLTKVKYIICDVTKKKLLKKNTKKYFDYVVNLSGYVDHSNKKKTFNSHYVGCKNLANIFLKKKPKAFVQIGSSGEYGRSKSPQKENFKCNPKSTYGKSKLLATLYLIKLYRKYNFPSIILRLYQAYGPRQDFNRFIPIIIKGCLEKKKFPCSNGKQLRDFIHVDDIIEAILKALKSQKAKGQIINIGSAKPRKIKNIIKYINKLIKGGSPQYGQIKLRKDEILKIYPKIEAARKKLSWKPKISFYKGLKSTIKFYKYYHG